MSNALKAMPDSRARSQRLETRLTPDQKRLIEHAASLQGRSVTDFVLASVQDAAHKVIEDSRMFRLSLSDSEAFAEAIVSPRPVNDRLRETVSAYRQSTGR